MTFSALDRSTWPELLLLPEVAVILRRKVGGIRKDLQARTFVPAPVMRRPYRWRRADVVAHLDQRSRFLPSAALSQRAG